MSDRPHPFDLVFSEIASESFPGLREELTQSGADIDDRDAFVLHGAAGQLLQDLKPPEAPPEMLDHLAALLHHAFRFWDAGQQMIDVDNDSLEQMSIVEHAAASPTETCSYMQIPPRRVWASLAPETPHEPLDGCFVVRRGGWLDVLGIFGLHPGREAYSVVAAKSQNAPEVLLQNAERVDGSPSFSTLLPAGESAQLYSLASPAELLLFTHRLLLIALPGRVP